MKRIILFILSAASVLIVSAQSYRPFPEAGYFWNERHEWKVPGQCGYEWHSCNDPVYFGPDTVIAATSYHTLLYRQSCTWTDLDPGCFGNSGYAVGEHLFAIIRQDTSLRRVFLYDINAGQEVLLYDFNLHAGDTLPPAYNVPTFQPVVVVRVDSVQLGDGFHRRWILDVPDWGPDSAALVEGVGSTFGLTALLVTPFENHDQLICFANSVQTIYPNSSTTCNLALGIPVPEKSSLQIFPNPFSDFLHIIPETGEKGTVEIFSGDGRVVLSAAYNGSLSLDVSGLSHGVYFLRFTGNTVLVKKIVKL